ncbi:LOB domain-containing protein 36 [Acorus calamus]|uniref:LOB domain-containing protein 36 n=1 Tax=Acorus calamus TaxID=4465 RepID=A0AAV9DYE5_ACOCL|nr:LOB domain-containing protein 36 [Acorus calamus]
MANCVFAPQFPPDQSERFASVHRVFGASNVSKILQDIDISQRNHAVDTLVYEAEARLQNPVYGPVAYIALLNETNQQIQHQLTLINRELSNYYNFLPPNPMHLSSVEQQQEQVRIEHQQQQQQMLEAHMMEMPTGHDQQQMMIMHGLEQQPTQMTSVTNQRQMMMHDQQQQSLQTAAMPMQRQMMMHVLQQQPSKMATVVGQRHMIVHEQQQQPPNLAVVARHQEIMMHGQHQQEQPPEMLEVAEQEQQQQQQRSRHGAKRRLASS